MLCANLYLHNDVYAQSNTPSKFKTEKGLLDKKKKGKGNPKRKNKALQKSYSKKNSNQTKHPGNIWVDPKPKDFTAIKERVEKKPSRKKLKTQKLRNSYFSSSSNEKHKSFGREAVLKRNTRLSYKYSSRSILSNKGNIKVKPKKRNYKKASRESQKHGGNIFLQPEATKKDFNEIKARVEKNPGKSMGKQINRQKNRAASNASLTQTYRGDIYVKARKGKQQTYKYDSKLIQKSSGNLKARRVKSAESQRKFTSSSSANFQGGVVLPARNHKRLRYKYMSKASLQNKGNIKKSSLKGPGPQQAATWKGDLKSNDKSGEKQWRKYESKKITKYSGEIKGRTKTPGSQYATSWKGDNKSKDKNGEKQWKKHEAKRLAKYSGDLVARKNKPSSGGNPQLTQNTGDIKVNSQKRQKKDMMHGSKVTGNYSGAIKSQSKKKTDQQHQKKSSKYTGHEGYIAVLSKKRQDKFMTRDSKITGSFSGQIVGLSQKNKAQAMEGKSLNMSEYRGEVKQRKYTKWTENSKSKSNDQANFQGNIKLTGGDLKEKQFEHMSKTAHNFTGNVKINNQYTRDKYFRNISERNQQIIGNFKTKLAKDIDEQIISAKVHNYQGGPKTSLFSRIWLTLFDNSGKLDKMDDQTRKAKYDSREYKIWY